jgi:tRNA (guanine6-N2)-methyltransferase
MADIFAITTRGLEQVSAQEMAALPETTVKNIAYRRVEVACKDIDSLATLRTVDDVFIKLQTWTEVGHHRSELARFTTLSSELDLEALVSLIKRIRPVIRTPRFSVTANFVGKRNYSAPEIKASVADGILSHYDEWRYSEDDEESDINLRVFIEHDTALIGMRLFKHPLHRRDYKIEHMPGSLKPPIAAALARLAGVKAGMTVLDPFCGGGTILVEVALMGANAVGGDVNLEALVTTQDNADNAGVQVVVQHWDAAKIPLNDDSADCVISNLPWGRQVEVNDNLKALYQASLAEMQRVVKAGGQILLLTTLPELLGIDSAEQTEISLYGQNPKIVRIINQK